MIRDPGEYLRSFGDLSSDLHSRLISEWGGFLRLWGSVSGFVRVTKNISSNSFVRLRLSSAVLACFEQSELLRLVKRSLSFRL